MTARTDQVAGDVAWGARGVEMPYDLINGYSGSAFPGVDQIRAWGKPFLLGFESATTRAYSGEEGGVPDARQLIEVASVVPGYLEANCGTWMCAADANSTPAWAFGPITAYFRVACLEFLAAGWVPKLTLGYGNRDAAQAAVEGIVAAGLPGDEWGVGTWGYGEGGVAHALPDDADAALVQSGNTPGLVDGTDFNGMYRDLVDFGAYGGPTAAPKPIPVTDPTEVDVLLVVVPIPGSAGHLARLMYADGYRLGQWASDGTSATELNGIPLGAGAAPKGARLVIVKDTEVAQGVAMIRASNQITAWRDALPKAA